MSEHRFVSFDGTPIFYRRFKPAAKKAALLLIHGMGEHGGRYAPIAEYLSGLGVEVFLPDLRGFGKSGGKRACVQAFSDFHQDLLAIHRHILTDDRKTPIFLMGHSFGGLVSSSYLSYMDAPSLKGLILSSPIFGIAIPVPRWRHWLGILSSYLAPDYTQGSNVNPSTLTHDPVLLQAYGQDKLIFHRISARLYRELTRMIAKNKEIASRIQIPALLLQAGDDRVVSRPAAVNFYRHLASADKELEVYEGLYHEILNEIDRQAIFTRIGNWLLKHL